MTELAYYRHLALLFAALFISGPADTVYCDHIGSRIGRMRRIAIAGRARAVVLFDRMFCDGVVGLRERA
ncbi:MAG: hypothetical protein LBE50_03870 [Gallionellaceae bacterium]|jgi:hypothetical protein|nr:hypothetical protein [Gallionellaceae bacterium]